MWCVWQPPASSAWASCSCCCQRSGTQSPCAFWPTWQTRSQRNMARNSQSPVSTPEAAVEPMALSPFLWHDTIEVLSKPLLTSVEMLSKHVPPLPTQEVRQDDRSTWTLYQEDRKDCLKLLNTDSYFGGSTLSPSPLTTGGKYRTLMDFAN